MHQSSRHMRQMLQRPRRRRSLGSPDGAACATIAAATQARRHGRQPDWVAPGLVLHGAAGWTPEADAVLRHAAPLPLR